MTPAGVMESSVIGLPPDDFSGDAFAGWVGSGRSGLVITSGPRPSGSWEGRRVGGSVLNPRGQPQNTGTGLCPGPIHTSMSKIPEGCPYDPGRRLSLVGPHRRLPLMEPPHRHI